MRIIESVSEMNIAIAQLKEAGKKIGFAPTMGALHNGHLSLVNKCKSENEICIVSVFVNPTQFNDKNDLANYPRDINKDAALLESAHCDIIFTPKSDEIYSKEEMVIPFTFDFNGMDKVMEGKFRPNHFNGVVQIVSKLFSIIKPNKAYFGEKDFQQVAIIKHMVKVMQFPIEIVSCPIVREKSGLAMSSRNQLLKENERKIAENISKILFKSSTFVAEKSVAEVQKWVINELNNTDGLQVEYFDIVDGQSLQEIKGWADSDSIVACITVMCGKIRLIDNFRYK